MQRLAGDIQLSASDLAGHLNCRYLTTLDIEVSNGTLAKPKIWDPVLEILAERGALHERSYVERLKADGFSVAVIDGVGIETGTVAKTLEAMKAGPPIIAQGALKAGHWSGRADILRRVEESSDLGSWSYEVIDTKLARETKGSTVLQICLYSDLLGSIQKRVPQFAHVVWSFSRADEKVTFERFVDFAMRRWEQAPDPIKTPNSVSSEPGAGHRC